MKFRQPREINGVAFESHAIRDLAWDRLPADLLALARRQFPPLLNGLHITHAEILPAKGRV